MFVGGLQRSGTTSVSDLIAKLEFTSKLSMTGTQMAQNHPWKIQNMTMDYFYDVVSEGAIEGKFIQDVYPYKYILSIVGESTAADGSIDEIVRRQVLGANFKPRPAVSDPGQRLLEQWSPYWDMSKAVLVEKTPENVLMAPYLNQLFGNVRVAHVPLSHLFLL